MDFRQSVQWLESLGQKMEGFDLENMKKLVEISGLQIGKLRTIHVAGSNGKGSTCAFIARILQEAGYTVGLYTSPHLVSPTERIKINGRSILEKKFAALASHYRGRIEQHGLDASYFEAGTMMALRHFLDEKVDFAVVEVGMGGRLDATNVITPLISVITSLSLEHTQYLGSTIERIAEEKVGIIKDGVPVVASPGNSGMKTIEKVAAQKHAELILAEYRIISSLQNGQEFSLTAPEKITGLKIKMLGRHQCENAALAVSAVISLRKNGYRIPESAIREGLMETLWQGRLEVVGRRPLIVLDVAHNPDGWKKLGEALGIFPYEKLFVVFGAMKDKDIARSSALLSKAEKVFIATVGVERAEEPENIKKLVGRGEIAGTVGDAIKSAMQNAGKNDMVLVTGSLFIVGEALPTFTKGLGQ